MLLYDDIKLYGRLIIDIMDDGEDVNPITLSSDGGILNINATPVLTSASALPVGNLPNSGATPGTYGTNTNVPVIEVDSKGFVTSITHVPIHPTFAGITLASDTGSGSMVAGQTLTINGTANQISVSVSGQTYVIKLPDTVVVSGVTADTLSGKLNIPIKKVTADYDMVDTDHIILADGKVAIKLPAITAAVIGKVITIKRISNAGPVTVLGNGSVIDGHTSIQIKTKFAAIKVCTDGTAWFIV